MEQRTNRRADQSPIKFIERQTYGRANFELLKARFLRAARNPVTGRLHESPYIRFTEIAPEPVFGEQVMSGNLIEL